MISFHTVIAFRQMAQLAVLSGVEVALVATGISVGMQEAELKTADAVLERYKRALGGSEAVQGVQSMTVHGEVESSARPGKSTFVYYARPFKSQWGVVVGRIANCNWRAMASSFSMDCRRRSPA